MKKQNSGLYDQENHKIHNSDRQRADLNTNPYDSENLDNESDSQSKDITEQDIEKDLKNNDPSEGFETDIDNRGSNGSETIEPDQHTPAGREFEAGQHSSQQIINDELRGDALKDKLAGVQSGRENF